MILGGDLGSGRNGCEGLGGFGRIQSSDVSQAVLWREPSNLYDDCLTAFSILALGAPKCYSASAGLWARMACQEVEDDVLHFEPKWFCSFVHHIVYKQIGLMAMHIDGNLLS